MADIVKENSKPIDILYICGREACMVSCDPDCVCIHTSKIEHAVNKDDLDGRLFEYIDRGDRIAFFEKKGE